MGLFVLLTFRRPNEASPSTSPHPREGGLLRHDQKSPPTSFLTPPPATSPGCPSPCAAPVHRRVRRSDDLAPPPPPPLDSWPGHAGGAPPPPEAGMASGRGGIPGPSRALLVLLLPALLMLLAFSTSSSAAASSPGAMHNNNWAVLVCTSRFWWDLIPPHRCLLRLAERSSLEACLFSSPIKRFVFARGLFQLPDADYFAHLIF